MLNRRFLAKEKLIKKWKKLNTIKAKNNRDDMKFIRGNTLFIYNIILLISIHTKENFNRTIMHK